MLKKIEIFLGVMLALSATLILMATGSRTPPAASPETTVPTTQAAVPETQTETQPRQEIETQPPAPPAAGPAPVSQARSQVEQILNAAQLEQTVCTRLTEDGTLNTSEQTTGQAADSHGCALAQVLQERQVNPISAFWKLVNAGLYEQRSDTTGELSVAGFRTPEQTVKEYAYTEEGARLFLTDLLTLAAQMEDGLNLELALLGANVTVEPDQVFYSQTEQCRYAYFTCTSDRATYILCFYFRGAERINDVEFQQLYLRHASGSAEELAVMDLSAKKQAATLMAASELLLTGKTRAGEGLIPFSYELAGAKATLECFHFTGTPDRGSLTNYRLIK